MAYGGSESWEVLCPVCKTYIETNNDDDMQTSLDLHYLNVHPTLRDIPQTNQVPVLTGVKYMNRNVDQEKECTNYIICPVCDFVVEIFQNNINHCFMEHFEIYHQSIAKFQSANHLSTTRRRSGDWTEEDFKKNNHNPFITQNPISKSGLQDLFSLPPDLEKQSGYIILNGDKFLCHICRERLDSQKNIEDHLKTKRHEDNVIMWLKEKLSNHMYNVMDFVSFYGSSLCCNLCRCKIDLNSNNPHETLINIISHNSGAKHSKTKSHTDTRQSNADYNILKSITEKNPVVNDHKQFIEMEMEPHFKCKLCDKNIIFSKKDHELEQNFLTHINSALHSKNLEAMTILQFFIEMNGDQEGLHCFFVFNGFINCKQCKCTIVANVEQLLEHCQGNGNVEMNQLFENKNKDSADLSTGKPYATKNNYIKLPSYNNSVPEMTFKTSSVSQLNTNKTVQTKVNKTKEIKKPYVKEILRPLRSQFGKITCIAENENGELTCLICNCVIQPSTHCVKMHIIGNFHKNKRQCQIKELDTLNLNTGKLHQELNLSSGETHEERNLINGEVRQEVHNNLLDHLFQALPQRFQEEKPYFTINLIDGSINCTLCDCVIDPIFMEDHLKEETHLFQIQLKRAYQQ